MFIGKYDQSVSYDFARMPGRSDSKPRPKRSMIGTAAKIGGGLAAGAAVLKTGKAGLAQKGLNTALKGSKLTKREAFGSIRQGAVNSLRSDAGKVGNVARKGAQKVKSGVSGAKSRFGTAMANRQKKKTQTMKIANQMRANS